LSKYARYPAGVVVYDERSAMRDRFHWARLLAFVTGLVNQELLLRNEYLAAENRILRAHLPSRLRLSDAERSTLAEIAKRLGRKALRDIARVAKPDFARLFGLPLPDRCARRICGRGALAYCRVARISRLDATRGSHR